ncbi:unnamed protein product [Anisakis simplex]|uniref:BPI2 domain-containing protein n=1 Tax=Anisakis simplex TaxID=6269 RepID=A0A0M3JXR5_ANISI|nr:unnamed protein product [Anisakis simplex]
MSHKRKNQKVFFANSSSSEIETNAGFVTRINQKGLDLMADFLSERVGRIMNHGEVFFNYSGQLSEQGSDFSTSIETIFNVLSSGVEIFGNSVLNVDRAVIKIHLTTAINEDGHLKTDLFECFVDPESVKMNFSETDSIVLTNYIDYINDYARSQIQEILCSTFDTHLVPVISNRLMNTPMSAALFDQYFLNYALLETPRYTNNFVELKHRGNSFGILRQGRNRLNDFRLPFRPVSFPVPSKSHGMVDFYMSNYTLSSLLYWMDQYKQFNYEISKKSINSSTIVGYLKSECGSAEVCAGTLFPALAAKYPNGIVQIRTHTITYPRVRLDEGKAFITMDSRVEASVQQPNRIERFLTASMSVEMNLKKVTFNDYTLKGEMRINKFRIFDVNSMVDGIDATSLEFLVSALNELVIGDQIAKRLQRGVKFPIIFDFTQRSSEVTFERNRIRISVDYCFDANCNDIAENQDNIDYYDNIQSL